MNERRDRPSAGMLDWGIDSGSGDRLHEERARQILARAAALDAERSSEIEIDQLREAAAAAGISPAAFEQALKEEIRGVSGDGRPGGTAVRAPAAAQVAHFAHLLRDLMGDDVQVVVVDDRIEARDEDGICVSIHPSRNATATVVASRSLQRRLLALALSSILPTFFGFMLAMDEEDAGIGVMVGVLLMFIASAVGLFASHRRETRELEKKADRVRRQLQRMLGPGTDGA